MRLLCINNKPLQGMDNIASYLNAIKEGEEYEGYQRDFRRRIDGVVSLGWCIPSISKNDGYALERFIPLSDAPAEVIEETKPKHATA